MSVDRLDVDRIVNQSIAGENQADGRRTPQLPGLKETELYCGHAQPGTTPAYGVVVIAAISLSNGTWGLYCAHDLAPFV